MISLKRHGILQSDSRQAGKVHRTLPEREIQGTSSLPHLYLGEVQDLFPENVPGVIYSPEQARANMEDLPVPASHPHLLTLLSLEIREAQMPAFSLSQH